MIRIKITFLLLCLAGARMVSAQAHTGERAQWFVDDRFGMFIHWGIYSGAEGIWKGEKIRHDNDYAEWIQYRNRIAKEEYLTLLDRFDWNAIDVEQWVLLAKKAGMKYVTLTAKHHDGFALWDSKASDYNITNYSNPKRDIVKELAAACKKHGLKMGLYYSHWIDWEHPYGWDHTKEIYPITAENYDQYWQEKVIPQMRELLTGYGDIGLIWFDMWVNHSESIVTKVQLLQLKDLIRELQPDCLVNSRLGLSIEEDPDVDFRTLGDNQLGNEKLEYPWQTPATVAHSWGFNSYEGQWKSTTTLLRSLIGNVSLNGNYMLNIGPRANGDVPYEITYRLDAMGKWLEVNGEAIYGSEAFELRSDQHDWGRITYKKKPEGGTKVYLHVFTWPLNKQLTVTGIKTSPNKIYALADADKSPLKFEHNGALTKIDLPELAPDPYVSVLVLEYNQKPETEQDLVATAVSGGYSLKIENAKHSEGNSLIEEPSRYGTIPQHAVVEHKQSYIWKIFIDRPTEFYVDASYSFQGKSDGGEIRIKANGQEIRKDIKPTGKTVGEPGEDWVIDNYASHRTGKLELDRAGYYEIELEIEPKQNGGIDFQWLWLEEITK